MATWQGIGMNYGHQTSSSSYNTTQIENDFTYLKSIGVTRLRIAFPEFDSSSTTINNCKDMVARALSHGFYVVWGVVAGFGAGTITSTRWSAFKTYVTGTLAPWAQSNGLSELCIGNENEFADDGTTLTNATMRADTRTMATTVKSGGFTGKVSYSTTVLSTYRNPWASEGIGDLDLIGFNSYDVLANFSANKPTLISQFGNKVYISEFGAITNGQADYANETAYYNDVVGRINSMRNAGVQSGYFFCFRDGNFGMPVNSFGLVQTSNGLNGSNWAHYALQAIGGRRRYVLRTFGGPVRYGTKSVYGLRTFGGPYRRLSAPSVATLTVALTGTGMLAASNPQLAASLAVSLAGVGTFASTLSATTPLASTLAGVSTFATSSPQLSTALTTTLAGAGALNSTLSANTALTNTLAGAGTLSGTLSANTALSTNLVGIGTLNPTLSANTSLVRNLAGAGMLAGNLSATTTLTIALAGVGTLNGAFSIRIALFVTFAAYGVLIPNLNVSPLIFPDANVVVYVRGGNVKVNARDGSAKVHAREGNVTVHEV